RKPPNDAGIGAWLYPFRHDIGVEKEAHKSISRGGSSARSTINPESRSGDAAKNSARLPTRLVLRSHSSAATTTTAVWPLRVMTCGPPVRARSITSLNFAFASATVHVSLVMVRSPYREVTMVVKGN